MSRLHQLREFVWPLLEPRTSQEVQADQDRRAADETSIRSLEISADAGPALDEARRYADGEEARRRVADQKATTYLAVVAALVPLVLTLATAIWDKKAGPTPTALNMILLGLAVLYVVGAAYWAFRVLEVAPSSRTGAMDIHAIWQLPDPVEKLTRHILLCARLNQAGINQKVTSIRMAHAYLLRAVLVFFALLLFNILWYVGAATFGGWAATQDPWLRSAGAALAATARVEALGEELSHRPAENVLRERCASDPRSAGTSLGARLTANRLVGREAVPASMLPRKDEQVIFRSIELRCFGRLVAKQNVWIRGPAAQRANMLGARIDTPSGASRITVRPSWPPDNRSAADLVPDIVLRQLMQRPSPFGGAALMIETEVSRQAAELQ